MLTIPWKAVSHGDVSHPFVQVSRLELARARDVPGFLFAASRLRRAALHEPGAVGVSLQADPFRRTFWTLSAWNNRQALSNFVRSDAHREIMAKYAPRMTGSHFHTWTCAGPATRPPTWGDARKRFDASIARAQL